MADVPRISFQRLDDQAQHILQQARIPTAGDNAISTADIDAYLAALEQAKNQATGLARTAIDAQLTSARTELGKVRDVLQRLETVSTPERRAAALALAESIANADIKDNAPIPGADAFKQLKKCSAQSTFRDDDCKQSKVNAGILQRLTEAARARGVPDPVAEDIGNLAYAMAYWQGSSWPVGWRSIKVERVVESAAADGVISPDERAQIDAAARAVGADLAGEPLDKWSLTDSRFMLKSPEMLSAFALRQAERAAAQTAEVHRTAAILGVAPPGPREREDRLEQALHEQADKLTGAWWWRTSSQVANAANTVIPQLQSDDADARARGNLFTRELVRHSIHFDRPELRNFGRSVVMANVDRDRGSFSDAGTKAGLAATIVTKLTPSQLGALEPQTAVALMLALHRTALAEHSTPLASLESDWGPSPIFSGASAERRDFQYWNVRFTTKPEGDEAVAAKRLQLYGPRAVTYTADGDQLSEIRYTPPGR